MTRAGLVIAGDASRSWVWAASRIGPAATAVVGSPTPEPPPAPPFGVHNVQSGPARSVVQTGQVFGGLHIHGHETAQVPDDSAWLRSCWEPLVDANATVEIRYLNRPGESCVDAYLLVRAEGPEPDRTEQLVADLRDHLAVLPAHATATPVTDDAETLRVLDPFRPDSAGILEIRKRLTSRPTRRDDAHHPWLTAVTPFVRQHRPWEPLWSALAGLPFRAMLSIGLRPYRVGPGLRAHLAQRATDLSRLARPGPSTTAVWRVARPADEFAAAAYPLATDALHRYTDHAFLFRASIAAEQPVPGLLAELAADTVSARAADRGFAGAGPALVRPHPAEFPTAWRNITSLDFTPLAAEAQGAPPEAVDEVARHLLAIVDLDEAAAVFRLPYRDAGQASPFGG
ncbi:hypothetical protein [Actinokineospora enzanensis]|uniref:hypothetical protein n=1 Tax=Actinokineospora enzanensis TaxID=155975 RepID=UPI00039AA486|nr:hypothetical protein [Actinokineospora enzanensis]